MTQKHKPEGDGAASSSRSHKPVMSKEVLAYLNLKPGAVIVDATLGMAGHALQILKKIGPRGKLIGLERDEESLSLASERLKKYAKNITLRHADFRDLDKVLSDLKIKKIDGILFDLGISSYQLDSAGRGFSFRYDGPLDMRMDKTSYISAADLVNNLDEKEISSILWHFGQERFANRIAKYLTRKRQAEPILTTAQLKDAVLKATPYKFKSGSIHPATRTFQALRIAVNRELEALEVALNRIPEFLSPRGRVVVISFHSLEDGLVKRNFKANALQGNYNILTKKPLEAIEKEVLENPRARSAKLRASEAK